MLTDEQLKELLKDVTTNRGFIDRISRTLEILALKISDHAEKIELLFSQVEEIDSEIEQIKN